MRTFGPPGTKAAKLAHGADALGAAAPQDDSIPQAIVNAPPKTNRSRGPNVSFEEYIAAVEALDAMPQYPRSTAEFPD